MRSAAKKTMTAFVLIAMLTTFLCQTGCSTKPSDSILLDTSYFYESTCSKIMTDEEFFAGFELSQQIKDSNTNSQLVCGNAEEGFVFAFQNGSICNLCYTDENLVVKNQMQVTLDSTSSVSGVFATDGRISLLAKSDADAWSSEYYWYQHVIDGSLADTKVMASELTGKTIFDYATDEEGNVYILTTDELISYDAMLVKRFQASLGDLYPISIATSKDTIFLLGEKEDLSLYISSLDTANGNVQKNQIILGATDSLNADIFVNASGNIIIDGDYGITCLDLNNQTFRVLYQYSYDTLSKPVDYGFTLMRSDGSLLFRAMYASDDNQAGEYQLSISETGIQKEEITVAAISSEGTSMLNYAVNSFNHSNSKYYAKIEGFIDDNSMGVDEYKRQKELFVAELLAGNSSDVFLLDEDMVSKLSSSDRLYNMEENEEFCEAINEMSLTDNIWAAGKTDNARYWVTPFYQLKGLFARSDIIESDQTLDMDTVEQLQSQYPDAAFISSNSINEYASDYYPYLLQLLNKNNSQEMSASDLSELLSQIKSEYLLSISALSHYDQIQNQTFLLDTANIRSFSVFCGNAAFYNDKFSFVSYPGIEATICADEYYAISAESENIDGACEFIEYLLSPQFQVNAIQTYSNNIPINEEALERSIENGRMTDEAGTAITVINGEQAPPIDHEYDFLIERYMDIILSSKEYLILDDEITTILDDELQYYWDNMKEADEVAEIVKSKIDIYYSE